MTRPINIQLVAGGSATMVVLKVPSSRKSSTRGHALLSQAGQISGTPNIRRGDWFSNSAGFRVKRSRCSHSPSSGRGQTVHQILPPMGTSRMIRAESQSTQMIIGPGVASGNLGAEQARQDDQPEYPQHRESQVELKGRAP